ncbi:GNAT family N-acetyltransferase [Phycicoccus sp. 3266]|uniref:GNAT family N-acetyltransferase n=1 Tax=Phycicoccus sp. 3266 TaxID=2817751 RepID=UPI0028610ED0|nr:GNAT family N-acetyltransferase [Phycicoccus sp. 3266]MDR6864851.1 GNAT superfamily N-acetyltransferase [Phycicoccus sp. 3266]
MSAPNDPAPAAPDPAHTSAPAAPDPAHTSAPAVPLPAIRPATPEDAGALAELFWQVRTESVPSIPMIVHPRESVLPFVETVLLREFEVWVAQDDDTLVGFLALMPPDQLGHLYITSGFTGRGLGTQLLGLAKTRFPDGLQLWAFQSNEGALRFYERHGFEPVEWTEGDNEEQAPDVRMVWKPSATGG